MKPLNERGSALLVTMMLLLILTAIGIYAFNVSTTEMAIALQSRAGTAVVNSADSGAHVGIDQVPAVFTALQPGALSDGSSYNWTSRATGSLTIKPGYGSNYRFADFEVTSIGLPPPQYVGQRTVQAVVNYGPVPVGTMY